MPVFSKQVLPLDDFMPIVLLVIAYIDENPSLYHEHVCRQTDRLLRNFPSKVIIAGFAQAAREYTEACYKLLVTTDNLAAHDLSSTQITTLASGLIQNKESAYKRYEQARLQVMSARTFQTRPLDRPAPPSTNW